MALGSDGYDPYYQPQDYINPFAADAQVPVTDSQFVPHLTIGSLIPSAAVDTTADSLAPMGGSGGFSGGGGYSGGSSGTFGPSAYGYHGQTGLDSNKGTAKYGFQQVMWEALQRANAGMKAAGLGSFGITDGFRSLAGQYDVKRRKPGLAATPGRSVHGLGLAADLKLTGAQQQWLESHAKQLGLMRLPSEAWHWQLTPQAYRSGNLPTASAPQAAPRSYTTAQINQTLRRVGI